MHQQLYALVEAWVLELLGVGVDLLQVLRLPDLLVRVLGVESLPKAGVIPKVVEALNVVKHPSLHVSESECFGALFHYLVRSSLDTVNERFLKLFQVAPPLYLILDLLLAQALLGSPLEAHQVGVHDESPLALARRQLLPPVHFVSVHEVLVARLVRHAVLDARVLHPHVAIREYEEGLGVVLVCPKDSRP